MSKPYNHGYQPPFPELMVYLHNGEERLGPFTSLLDTGADITFVPTYILEEIGAVESVQAQIRSHFGEVQRVWMMQRCDVGGTDASK
jgi:hypothetical protein